MPDVLVGVLVLGGIIGLGFILPESVTNAIGSFMDYLWYIGIRVVFWVPTLIWFSGGVAIALLVIAILVPPLGAVGEEIIEFLRIGADLVLMACIWAAVQGLTGEWTQAAIGAGAFLAFAIWNDYSRHIL